MKMKLNLLQEVSEEKKSLFCFSTALILLLSLIYFVVVPLFGEAVLAKRECSKINEQVKIYEAFSKRKDYLQMEKEQLEKLQALDPSPAPMPHQWLGSNQRLAFERR